MNRWLRYLVSGMFIGCANVVPGVSGGTVAVTLGVYDRIIASLSIRAVLRSPRQVIPFLGVVAAGALAGVLIAARIIASLLAQFALEGVSFFIGLIIGGFPQLFRTYRTYRFRLYDIPICLLGGVLALAPTLLGIAAANGGSPVVSVPAGLLVASGFVAGAAMILPGLSGSLTLLLFGTYAAVLAAINTLDIGTLALFGLAAASGILCCAAGIRRAFRAWPGQTWALILGLVLGSIVALWPPLPTAVTSIIQMLAVLLVGLLLSYLLASVRSK